MYDLLTSIRIFLNFSDVNNMRFYDLIDLEIKNIKSIKDRMKKEKEIIYDSETRYLDRELFKIKHPNKKYNPKHPVAENMKSLYGFVVQDQGFKNAMTSILEIRQDELYTKKFYNLLEHIEAHL